MLAGTLDHLPPKTQLLVGVWVIAAAVLVLGFGWWVYRDASLRGSTNPLGWAVASVVGFQVMSLLYPLLRKRIGPRTEPPTRIERAVPAAVAGILISFVIGALVTPPDPFSQIAFTTGAVVVAIPAAYVLVSLCDRRAAAN